jgi:hypothetical protein
MRANENKRNPKRSAPKETVKLLEKLHEVQALQSSAADVVDKIRVFEREHLHDLLRLGELHDAEDCCCPLCETARRSLGVYEVLLVDIMEEVETLRKELAEHPHVPNKKERRAARQAAAKKR